MPLNIRSIAVSIAVTCFFAVSLIAGLSGLPPFVCCKRAVIGAAIAYIVAAWLAKAVNAVFISAMVTEQLDQQKLQRTQEKQQEQEVNDSGDRH
jgi:hypothetical protein